MTGSGHVEALRGAAERFWPARRRFLPLGGSTGYSGSVFARVEADGGMWCLRRWPRRVGARRLGFVHRALAVSRSAGFLGVPALARTQDGGTIVRLGRTLYDAQEWVGGQPLAAPAAARRSPNRVHVLPAARIARLAAALAAFHASTEGVRVDEGARISPLTVLLEEVRAAVDGQAGVPVPLEPTAERRELTAEWSDVLAPAVRAAERILSRHPQGSADAGTLCHGDLWPSHVFVVGEAFSGFVDFESIGFGSPATDLAHLLLHFGGWEVRRTVLDAYRQVRALPPEATACLPAAALLDAASEGAWALAALRGRPSRAQRDAHLANLRGLLGPVRTLLAEAS